MTDIKEKAVAARDLFLQEYQGILCTNSVEMPGYPFGSVVPYCLNNEGMPVILISNIAQHTKNIKQDSKVSLFATEGTPDDMQTVGRVTFIGDAKILSEDRIDWINRYYEYFPQSRDYHKTHDFYFYTIELKRVRFIGGFGQIYWIEKEDFITPNPFSFEQEQHMVQHMNTDHMDAIRHYCDLHSILLNDDEKVVMAGIDSEGFHLRINKRIYRIKFQQSVSNSQEVRAAMVAMAREK